MSFQGKIPRYAPSSNPHYHKVTPVFRSSHALNFSLEKSSENIRYINIKNTI